MPSTYSSNLGFELPTTGEQSGTWGTTVNTNVGTLIEQAISGYVTQSITDGADTTITLPNGATGVARNMFLELTGSLSATRNLIVPANRKLYFIYNNTTGGYAVTVKVSGQTGVSVPAGQKMLLVCNGTDVVTAVTSVPLASINSTPVGNTAPSTGAFTTLSASSTVSGAGFSTYLASPPAIGSTSPSTGSFTSVTASGTVSGSTVSGAGSFTTLSASSTVSGNGFTNYLASPQPIGTTTPNIGRFTAAYTAPVVATYGTTTTINCSLSNVFTVAMTGNITTLTLSNFSSGQTINVFFLQDATGSRTVTWPTFKWPGGTVGVLSTAANAEDILVLTNKAGTYYATLSKGFA